MAKKKKKISRAKKAQLMREALSGTKKEVSQSSLSSLITETPAKQGASGARKKSNQESEFANTQIKTGIVKFGLITISLVLLLVALFVYSQGNDYLDILASRLANWLNI